MEHSQFLSLFAQVGREKDKIKESEYLIIFIDEGETNFHPEWERNYIKILKDYLSQVYFNNRIHLVITPHSPFVASDLPRENMIMLDVYDEKDEEVINGKQNIGNCKVVKNKDIKTFGANIFDLYTEAFFVESSFGEFAKGKIKEVVKDLTSNEKGEYGDLTKERIKEIEYIIDSIGEKLVSTKLEKLYEEYRNNKNSVEYKKEQLKMLQEKLGLSNEQMINIIKNGDLND